MCSLCSLSIELKFIFMYMCTLCVQLAFKWFDRGMTDLEYESQVYMFNSRVLKVDPSMLDAAGYSCLRNFFETINLGERKLKRVSGTLSLVSLCFVIPQNTVVINTSRVFIVSVLLLHFQIVENPDLTGIDYLWRVRHPDEHVTSYNYCFAVM